MNSVITYIFGKNKELLREPKVIDKDTEYICVTDQKDLTSKTWKIIYEPMEDIKSLRDKVVYVKFQPFKYTNAEKICVMDSSFEIICSLEKLFYYLEENKAVFKKHTNRKTLKDELPLWINRGLRKETFEKFYRLAAYEHVNLEDVMEFEGCIFLLHNDKFCKELCETLIDYMRFLGSDGNLIITNQCPLSYIIHQFYKEHIGIINFNIQKNFFIRYEHNTNEVNNT